MHRKSGSRMDAMNVMTISEAKENLGQLIEQAVSSTRPPIIRTDTGQRVVLLSLDEFSSWQETFYLLSSPANVEHLRRSIIEAKTGKTVERNLIEV